MRINYYKTINNKNLISNLHFQNNELIMIIEYIYFPYVSIFLYNISSKSFDYYRFFNELSNFHSNVITHFNIYREYIFDNKTNIKDNTPFVFLAKLELDSYNKISVQISYLDNFINKNLKTNDELIQFYSKDLCSFYITDYFDSEEECKIKYSYIIDYDFTILFTNFLRNLRNLKNLVKYKFETENIIGRLDFDEDQNKKGGIIPEFGKPDNDFGGPDNDFGNPNNEFEDFNNQNEESDKESTFKLDLFNNETLHSEINLMYINIFLPYIDNIRKIILKNVSIEGNEYLFIIYFCIYLLLVCLIFLIYLFPMIRHLSNTIYKTKQILLIIPMKILTSQVNIKSLLKLN